MSPMAALSPWLHQDEVLVPSLLLLLSLLTLTILRRSRRVCNSQRRLPPSPPKLPFIGNLHQVGSRRHRSIAALSQKHGPLMLLQLGQVPTLVVSSAEMAEQIMKTHDVVFANRPQLEVAKHMSYGWKDVAFSQYGQYWRDLRKIFGFHLLGTRKVPTYRLAREEEVASMIEKIERLCSASGVVDLTAILQDFMVDMIWRVVHGRGFRDEGLKKVSRQAMEESLSVFSAFHIGDYFPSLRWLAMFTGFNSKVQKADKKREHVLTRIFENHQMNQSGDDDEKCQEDFVDVLLSLQKDPSEKFSLATYAIKALLSDALSTGTDTTFITLEWTMAELIHNPVVMKKAQDEVRGIVGAKPAVEEADITHMNYLRAVIKETLRLCPVATLLVPHFSTDDVQIDGYDVPKQTTVLINAWAIMRDPKYWEAPEEFRPERFLARDSRDFKGNDFQFIPFGSGRRICPGMQFAMSIIELAVANLLHRFDWELPGGMRGEDLDMTETFGVIMRRKLRLHVVPKPREL